MFIRFKPRWKLTARKIGANGGSSLKSGVRFLDLTNINGSKIALVLG